MRYLAAVLILVLAFVFSYQKISSYDIGFHLATGEYILNNREIPKHDIFSYTIPGKRWVNSHWLFQLILAVVGKTAGYHYLPAFQGILLVIAFILIFKTGTRSGINPPWLYAVSAVTLLMVYERLTVRPDIFSILFLSIYLYIFQTGLHRTKKLYLILPVQLLWVNSHGLFALGLFIQGAYILEELLKGRKNQDIISLKRMVYVFGLSLLCGFINPNFIDGFMFSWRLFGHIRRQSAFFLTAAMEMEPPFRTDYINTYIKTFRIYAVFLPVALLFSRKRNPGYIIALAGLMYNALSARRTIPFFALFSIPLYASMLESLTEKIILRKRGGIKTADKQGNELITLLQKNILYGAVVLFCVFMIRGVSTGEFYIRDNYDEPKIFGGGFSHYSLPVEAVNYIISSKAEKEVFCDHYSGAYFSWKGYPEYKTFIDSRLDLYDDFLQEYALTVTDYGRFRERLKKYGINTVMLNSSSKEAELLFPAINRDPEFYLSFLFPTAAVFEKRKENRTSGTVPDNLAEYMKNVYLVNINLPGIGHFPYGAFRLGHFLALTGFPDYAIKYYEEGLTAYQPHSKAWNNLGVLYGRRGDNRKAHDSFIKALQYNPKNPDAGRNITISRKALERENRK